MERSGMAMASQSGCCAAEPVDAPRSQLLTLMFVVLTAVGCSAR